MDFLFPQVKTLLLLALFATLLVSCNQEENLIPEAAREELSDRTVVQTQWTSEEETIEKHRKQVSSINTFQEKQEKQEKVKTIVSSSTVIKKPTPPKTVVQAKQKEGFILQLGAFSNKQYAEKLVRKLKKEGHQPFLATSKNEDNTLNLVRVGPYASKEDALGNAAIFAKSMGIAVALYSGSHFQKVIRPVKTVKAVKPVVKVVKVSKKIAPSIPAPKAAKKEPSQKIIRLTGQSFSASASQNYSFQIGGLYNRKTAEQQKKKLQAQGYKMFTVEVQDHQSEEIWYSLRIGYFESLGLASDAAFSFTEKEGIPTKAIPLD